VNKTRRGLHMIEELLMNEHIWDTFSVIWFIVSLVIVLIVFIPSDIHLWKFGKVSIFPMLYLLNFMICLFTVWYIAIPIVLLITLVVYKAYDAQIVEVYNWEKNGGYALNIFKLKKQLKEFPNKSLEEKERILSKSAPNMETMKVSLAKLIAFTVLPNAVLNVVINYFFE